MKRKKLRVKGLISFITACALIGHASFVSSAQEMPVIDTTLSTPSPEATDAAFNMAIDSNQFPGWPQGPQTYGEAAIVMDADSGAILYAKNIDGKAYPASITKILTMLVALDYAAPDQKVTFSQESIDCLGNGYAHIGMLPGEEISLTDALNALMLASANEVAHAIGESVGEGYDWFINQMNETARSLGAVHSNFVNTNGLSDENHYTTARDMALITRELFLNYQEFQDISQTSQYTIGATNLEQEPRIFQQKHQMFYPSYDNYYEYAVAGKTGYTDEALNTLVTCADNGEMRLICVVLKTHGKNVYTDTRALFDYAYGQFHKVPVADLETSEDIASVEEGGYVVLPDGIEFSSLEKEVIQDEETKTEGTIAYRYQGNPVGTVSVKMSESYLEENTPQVLEKEEEKVPESEEKLPVWKWAIFFVLLALIFIFVWFLIALCIRNRRRKMRRERMRRENQRQQGQKRRKR